MAVTGIEAVSTADLKMACDSLNAGIQSAQQAASAAQSTASAAQTAAGTAQSGVDGLDGRVTALEGKVVPPLTMFPVGAVYLTENLMGMDPSSYIGGEWLSAGQENIGNMTVLIWVRRR